jgi:hypothetical protein
VALWSSGTLGTSFGRFRHCYRVGCRLWAESSEPAANNVEGWREDQSERRDTDHTGEHRGTKRLPELGPGARRPYQGHDTENEGERRHEDRPQPQPRSFHGRGPAITATVLKLPGELNDEYRILCRKSNQHDDADLGEYIVILSAPDSTTRALHTFISGSPFAKTRRGRSRPLEGRCAG